MSETIPPGFPTAPVAPPVAETSLIQQVQDEAAKFVTVFADDVPKFKFTSSKFSRANVRRVALSGLKGFVVAAAAVVVARKTDLASGHLTVSVVQSVALQAFFAGGAAVAKVAEVFLED